MKLFFLMTAAIVAFGQGQSAAKVVKQQQPEKALIFEVSIPAPRVAVWQAFTTSEGLSTWLTPGAVAELKKGGEWTAHFPGGKTGGGTILAFTPKREIVMAAMAPEQFPTVRAWRRMPGRQPLGEAVRRIVPAPRGAVLPCCRKNGRSSRS